MAVVGFDPSLLLNYYASRLPLSGSQVAASPLGQNQGQAAVQIPPWDQPVPAQEVEDVQSRSSDPYFDPTDTTLLTKANGSSGTAASASSELAALLQTSLSTQSPASSATPGLSADNDKLFALYSAITRLDNIAQMATRDTTVSGQLPGLDTSFQAGLSQIQSFVGATQFNNVSVLPGANTPMVQASIAIPYPPSNYTGGAIVPDAQFADPVPGVSASQSFTVSITKAGTTTPVAIDLSQISGPLTVDNIAAYTNQQLAANGFGTRFSRVQTGGDIADGTATWGLQIQALPTESVSLSSAQATPALYVAGTTGTPADAQGKLVKLTDLDSTPQSTFSTNITPDSGTATAKATVVDAQGDVYVVGNSTGSFGNEINQGAQDVYLTKYDSSGNTLWTKLLGSADTASGYGLALNPAGGVVVAGSVTGDLSPSSIGGNADSFVAKYDADGNQTWLRQVAPLSPDQANAVSVDSSGNVYIGGQTMGTLASGQTNQGGQDAYITKLSSKGQVVFQNQFGTSGTDSVSATAIAPDGNLLVASVQSGHAILSKYDASGASTTPIWQEDLGDLQGGAIGGLTVANGQVYVSGTTSNAALDAGGAARVAHASSGGTDAFVFAATDNGASATPDYVSYVGTDAAEQGGGVTAVNGQIYLTGTTTGTFAGQTRNADNTHNLFVTLLDADGSVNWTQQYGGVDGQSQGFAIAADAQGSSVLDALGLPRGTINNNPSSELASQTTLRAGDMFSMQIQDAQGTRTVKVTVEQSETLQSLATKISSQLLFDGKATAMPTVGGQTLQIAVNAGVQVQLIAGPQDFDALAGLGIKPQTLVGKAASTGSSNSSSSASSSTSSTTSTSSGANASTTAGTSTGGPQVIGLNLNSGINLLDSTSASHADVVLQAALSLIKQAYTNMNTPASATASAGSQSSGAVPAYLQSQIASYQTALAAFGSASSSSASTNSLSGLV